MGGRNAIFLAAAAVIGLIAVFIANSYFSGVEQRQERAAEQQQLDRIVVATQPLEFGTVLTAENIRMQNFPANSVPEGAFHSIDELLSGGRVTLRSIVPNEPILAGKVSGSGGRAVLSANLADGMRAVSIPVNAVRGVSGFVRPGDVVDIFMTRQIPGEGSTEQDLVTEVLLENIKVLAIDQNANEANTDPQVGQTAVVEVDQTDAQKLVLADRIGILSLALRNVEDQDEFASQSMLTSRTFASSRLYVPARRTGGQSAPAGLGAAMAQAIGSAAGNIAPIHTGPTMTVYRGVEVSEEPVGTLGGS